MHTYDSVDLIGRNFQLKLDREPAVLKSELTHAKSITLPSNCHVYLDTHLITRTSGVKNIIDNIARQFKNGRRRHFGIVANPHQNKGRVYRWRIVTDKRRGTTLYLSLKGQARGHGFLRDITWWWLSHTP